ncbi:MAG: hypothetical protein CVV02_02435 [Firmicutes bacterium HGW-Firmicutes-7]|nr:MAG: hypothetical protein CVV02_02435 [Firmicutes bacterium HGW-Firmicutes-7]
MLTSIGFYFLILIVKIFEVTLATTRIVLITKGEKVKGAIIGFFEVIIWIALVSTVLDDITSDPIKILVYALGFAIGNYVGTSFEQMLGVGTVRVEAIVKQGDGDHLVSILRDSGFAVTVIEGEGMSDKRHVLIMHIKRKRTNEVVSLIKGLQENVVITINEVKPIYGGYGVIKK